MTRARNAFLPILLYSTKSLQASYLLEKKKEKQTSRGFNNLEIHYSAQSMT